MSTMYGRHEIHTLKMVTGEKPSAKEIIGKIIRHSLCRIGIRSGIAIYA